MSVSKSIMHFREKRANELELIAKSIEKEIGGDVNTYPIFQAVNQLKNANYIPTLKDGTRNPECWGYSIEDFQLPIDTNKHVRPKGITKLVLTLNMSIIANTKDWMTLSDPLCELNFNVMIRGVGNENYYSGFHIDKHDFNKKTTEPHPIYHLHFTVNPLDSSEFSYGSVLHLDTPRIMHYPMDFILGIGFLTSNFFPVAFEALIENGTFANIYRDYQEGIWKPFAHTLANHWPFDKGLITWNPSSQLCPYIA